MQVKNPAEMYRQRSSTNVVANMHVGETFPDACGPVFHDTSTTYSTVLQFDMASRSEIQIQPTRSFCP